MCAALVSVSATGATPAAADAQQCLPHLPTATADYRAVVDNRDASFGIGDVTSSVALPDGRRFFALGDTAYYNVQADGSTGPLTGFGNNSAWVQSGKCFTLLDSTTPGSKSWIVPPQQDGSMYWPGASVVVGSKLYVFVQRLRPDSTFGTSVGASVAEFDLPSLQLARITPIPWAAARVFGSAAVYDGGYVYTYASQRRGCAFCFSSDMYVARVPDSELMVPSAWQFRSGSEWVTDFGAATPVLANAVSNTDIQPYANGFLLITKPISIIGPSVEAWWAPNPDGPWRDLGTVYTIPDPPDSRVAGDTYHSAYTYNPIVYTDQPLADGSFLGSFNVNTFDPSEANRDAGLFGPRFFSLRLPATPPAPPRVANPRAPAPWDATFGIDRFGHVRTGGGTALAESFTAQAVGVAPTPTARGGWVAAADGGVFAFGDAKFFGSMGGVRLNQPIVGITATPTGRGYWLVARDGGIFSFGDAPFFGSTGSIHLNQPIVAMAVSPTGRGYWFVASDGGIFAYGDARFSGSTGSAPPFFPVRSMAATPDGRGYWLLTIAGQVLSSGDATALGDAPLPLAAFCVGIVGTADGYRIVDTSGHVFGHAPASGPMRISMPAPLVAAG